MLALALLFATTVVPQLRLETDILALLPKDEHDVAASAALQRYSESLSRRAVFLVGAPQPQRARAVAQQFADELRAAQVFARVQMEVDARTVAADAIYVPYRQWLLSQRVRERLLQGDVEPLYADALRAIYNPGALPRPLPVVADPLNLLGDFLTERHAAAGAARLQDGVLMVSDALASYVLVGVQLEQGPFAATTQERLMPVIERAIAAAQAQPDVRVIGSGLILHAAAATRSATREISTVGSLSMVGVVLMVLLTFRSPRPLLLSALVLASGAVAAITACHFVFERIHMVTLVFGTGLIGVGVDYSNHYLADQFRAPRNWSPVSALRHVGPGIVVGMSCAVLGYLGLALAPLPGLRQMALFCAVGLVTACASVLFWYPLLARPAPRVDSPVLLLVSQWFDRQLGRLRWHRLTPWCAAVALAVAAIGLWRLQFSDDLHLLQSSPEALINDERALRSLLRNTPDSRLFLVRGSSPAAVLENEERLGMALDRLVDRGALTGYQAVSKVLPSPSRQAENRRLLGDYIYNADGIAPRLLRELGFAPEVIGRERERFLTATEPLLLTDWLQTTAAEPYRHLWLGALDGGYASIVNLVGVVDVAALHTIEGAGLRYIDKVAEISAVLERYRQLAAMLIAGTYLLIAVLLARRYGVGTALRLLMVPVGAAALTLALFGLLGITASLFNVLALFVVLGLGVDYGVFLRESRDARGATLLALLLSTLGTVLAYGLLAFSETPFIRSLGLTLLAGISLTYVLALLSQRPSSEIG